MLGRRVDRTDSDSVRGRVAERGDRNRVVLFPETDAGFLGFEPAVDGLGDRVVIWRFADRLLGKRPPPVDQQLSVGGSGVAQATRRYGRLLDALQGEDA